MSEPIDRVRGHSFIDKINIAGFSKCRLPAGPGLLKLPIHSILSCPTFHSQFPTYQLLKPPPFLPPNTLSNPNHTTNKNTEMQARASACARTGACTCAYASAHADADAQAQAHQTQRHLSFRACTRPGPMGAQEGAREEGWRLGVGRSSGGQQLMHLPD